MMKPDPSDSVGSCGASSGSPKNRRMKSSSGAPSGGSMPSGRSKGSFCRACSATGLCSLLMLTTAALFASTRPVKSGRLAADTMPQATASNSPALNAAARTDAR
jgi:hypothetical protein